MKTVRISGRRQVELIDKPMPTIGRDYVLLKVHVAPMCNEYLAYRDLVYLERNRPDSLGHEMAGEVLIAPESAPVKAGDRVVALCGYPCGHCDPCLDGYYAHCISTDDPAQVCGSESGECGFAQYAIKPAWMLVRIPDTMSYEHASMACCGLGPTFGAMQRMRAGAGDTILLTGLGAVGLGGVINARFRGARTIAVVRSAYRADLARRLGADIVLDPGNGNVTEAVRELTGGRGVDFAIECSGQSEYQQLAVKSLSHLGTAAFLAEPGSVLVEVERDLVAKGATLLGSLDINRRDADRLLGMIARIPDQLDTYITHRFAMADLATAFELQAARECGKVLLYPWAG
jgi:threonine dehydrogenase-like Zn-dependent dehydrogenase